MSKITVTAALLLLSTGGQAAEIYNFKSGLACTDGLNFGWVCHETEKIFISGQGTCVYNGEETPCTWYGFQFEYKGFTQETVFECTANKSVPMNIGNPEREEAQDAVSNTYILDDI